MGGFEFGNVQHLGAKVTMLAFLCIIAFVVLFDFLAGLMEYYLSDSPQYNKMIQLVYKELMLMGLLSFTIIMSEALQSNAEVQNIVYEEWVAGIEFSHILVFFLTFFFVFHSFFLMRTSVVTARKYRQVPANLIEAMEELTDSQRNIFNLQYFPLSPLRDKVEFQLLHFLFNETYVLSDGFNFSSYLSGCFDRYALKTINRSSFTWIVLMVACILNYGRIEVGYGFMSCEDPIFGDKAGRRKLAGAAGEIPPVSCAEMNVKLFIFMALLLVVYAFALVLISRHYKIKMISRAGVAGPHEYLKFLRFAQETQSFHHERMVSSELRKEIEDVMDADEYVSEDEEEFREVAEILKLAFHTALDTVRDFILYAKVFFVSLVHPKRVAAIKMESFVLARTSAVAQPYGLKPSSASQQHDPRSAEPVDTAARGGRHSGRRNSLFPHREASHHFKDMVQGSPANAGSHKGASRMLSSSEIEGDQAVSFHSPSQTYGRKRRTSLFLHKGVDKPFEKFQLEKAKSELLPQSILSCPQGHHAELPIESPRPTCAAQDNEESIWGRRLSTCFRSHKVTVSPHDHSGNEFVGIYLFGKPLYYFRAVELLIMFNCLYLAFWTTNFIVITMKMKETTVWKIVGQILMTIPLVLVVPSIGYIAEICSILTAISELNLEVVHRVLVETEDVSVLVNELRVKILQRIDSVVTAEVNNMDIIHGLFSEIDKDGSGCIDQTEFRLLLKSLKLTYSDERFKRLYRAVDVNGDNKISREEIDALFDPAICDALMAERLSGSPENGEEVDKKIGKSKVDSFRRSQSKSHNLLDRLKHEKSSCGRGDHSEGAKVGRIERMRSFSSSDEDLEVKNTIPVDSELV